MSAAILEARQLAKHYAGVRALDGLDLAVAAGEIVCLLGANGAGKTTTLNLFLGFTTPSSGEAFVAGRSVRGDPNAARARLGYVPEIVALYPSLTGAENVEFFHALTGKPRLSREARDAILKRLDFPVGAVKRRVETYSKGMRQKLGLAIALAKDAQAILLDEPLSGLDPASANDLVRVLKEVAGGGAALLISTHDIFRATEIADRIGIMRHGKLVEWVDPKALTPKEIEAMYLAHMAERAV
ncbi:MAG: ABC transporter ATP-binding protein [Terricaulis sp.]